MTSTSSSNTGTDTDTEHGMGFYRRQILPRMINVMCGDRNAEPHRRRVCAGLAGHVLEIGFGSGLNVPFYPDTVSHLTAVDPSEVAWRLADKRLKASPIPVHWAAWTGSRCRSPTTAATRRCPHGPSARSPTRPLPSLKYVGCSNPAAPSTSSNTVWLRTHRCNAGNADSTR